MKGLRILAVETWIAIALSMIAFLGVRFIANFDENFVMLRSEISQLSDEMKKTNQTMIMLNERQANLLKAIDDHEERLRRVETQ